MERSLGMTDQNGRYKIDGLRNGITYSVDMEPMDGNYPVQTASIVAGTDTTKDFILGIGAVLSGTITAKNSIPVKRIAGAMLYIKDQATGVLIGGRVYYSGADGTYTIHDIKNGNYTLEVFHPDYRSYSADISIGESDISHDVAMETGASFKGTVKDSSGNPLSGVTVIATRAGATSVYTITNSTGSYNIYGLDETKSDYTISAQKQDYDRQIMVGKQPTAAGTIIDFTLSLPATTYQVSGIVKTSDNAAVKDATVLVSSTSLNFYSSVTTAADGSYMVPGLVNMGSYTIAILGSGNLPMQANGFTVNNANVSLNFTIPLGKDIGGYVGGNPVFPSGKRYLCLPL